MGILATSHWRKQLLTSMSFTNRRWALSIGFPRQSEIIQRIRLLRHYRPNGPCSPQSKICFAPRPIQRPGSNPVIPDVAQATQRDALRKAIVEAQSPDKDRPARCQRSLETRALRPVCGQGGRAPRRQAARCWQPRQQKLERAVLSGYSQAHSRLPWNRRVRPVPPYSLRLGRFSGHSA